MFFSASARQPFLQMKLYGHGARLVPYAAMSEDKHQTSDKDEGEWQTTTESKQTQCSDDEVNSPVCKRAPDTEPYSSAKIVSAVAITAALAYIYIAAGMRRSST